MIKNTYISILIASGYLLGCSPDPDTRSPTSATDTILTQNNIQAIMRPEFMESCSARPENVAKRRNGTIEKHCKCIFNTTMKGLSEGESELAGLYLYGETHDAFKARLKTGTLNTDAMRVAANAVAKAAKRCR